MRPVKTNIPKVGPANNAHHWKDWQARHRMPRPIDLLVKIHGERMKKIEEAKNREKELQEINDEIPIDTGKGFGDDDI